ncbi:MAG: hypothetical protein HY718_19440 [Planctomycetes bacterium]|nr:hypothetical protein [Planctomycetota bacterium]
MVGLGKNICALMIGVIAWLPSVLALPPSKSKLGVHLIQNNTAGVAQIGNAHPRVMKILDTWAPMLAAARNYKAGTPDGRVVLRVYTTRAYGLADSPAASANDFFYTVLRPAVHNLAAADRAAIDYLEGPNECESTPCWNSVQDATWYNDFWVALAPLIAAEGFKPCAFSIPVGNPAGTVTEMQQRLAAIVPALRVCRQLGGAWSYHAYTPNWSTDVGFQIWYSLRYRQFYDYFAQAYPDVVTLPLILTEGGFDSGGSPTGSGWQANGTASQYEAWLTWWDGQIRKDPYVLGSTLFQIGSPATWPSFDLEPIAGWLAGYLDANATPALAVSTTSLTATTMQGTDAVPASFTVTNTGHHTMTYAITDNADWLSTTPAGGENAGEPDTIAVNFATAGLAAGLYNSQITVTAPGADYSPRAVTIYLTVNPRPIPGDLDGNQRVNNVDLAIFLGCMTGADAGPPDASCTSADLDDDNDVDQSDFAVMQQCMTGDLLIGDPDCAD